MTSAIPVQCYRYPLSYQTNWELVILVTYKFNNINELNMTFSPQGIKLINALIDEYSLPVVHAYMEYIQVLYELCTTNY